MTRTKLTTIGIAAVAVLVLVLWGTPPTAANLGNELMISSSSPPDYLDPAMSYQAIAWQTMINAYDGLLTYPKGDGPEAAELVPNLATEMPELLDGGKRVVFTVRKGVRFAPPVNRELKASDVRYGLQRSLWMNSPGQGFYLNIVGAKEIVGKPGKDAKGIVVDDAAGTIEFQLERPDATFLYALALPFAYAVPTGTPTKDMSNKGFVPATGPYMFKEYVPQRRIVLERNPNYEKWGEHAGSANVDGMTIQLGVNPENAVTQIMRGKLDYTFDAIPRSKLPSLLKNPEWKDRIHISEDATTSYIFMNYRSAPFNSRKMRQAVNWAIDRRAMVKLTGGMGTPSSTILPPSMPGYRDHKLYPGPDLDKARQLVRESGVRPGKIDIWCRTNEPNPTVAVYLQSVLNDLGFRASVKCVDSSNFFTLVGNENTKAAIGLGNWGQDFPEGSNFIDVLLNGKRITPSHSNNISYYSGADDEIEAANRLIDQDARNKAWGDLDEQIMRDAAWAPWMHSINYRLVSERLENYVEHPVYNLLFMEVKLAGAEGGSETDEDVDTAAVAGGGSSVDPGATARAPVRDAASVYTAGGSR